MSQKRILYLYTFILLSFGILTFRLFDIIENDASVFAMQGGNSYSLVIDKNRGMIYDRNLSPLVSNESVYKVAVLPSLSSRMYLKSVLSENEFEKIEEKFEKGVPFTFESEIFIKEEKDVKVFISKKRYGKRSPATHLIGYCDSTQTSGVVGIEKSFDDLLSSQTRSISISYLTDASGKVLSGTEPTKTEKNYSSLSGIALTLDSKIQDIAQRASSNMSGNGSVLVMDVKNGEILASVSVPDYDRKDIASSINSQNSALLNRNLCAYNIGSTYKIIVAAAALSKNISPSFYTNCEGNLTVQDTVFNCHKQAGHGNMNMRLGFANSCNPYFINLGLSVGKERLLSLSAAMGLGKEISLCKGIKTAAGNLPRIEDIKTDGDLANISFGQGALMATPVHIAKIISIVANGGYDISPSLFIGEVTDNGQITKKQTTNEKTRIISSDICETIQDFMITTIQSGTGKAAKPANLSAGGKTASAETGWSQNGEKMVQAWFSGFYPADNPKYAIVILNEAGRSGASSCAPIFKEICDNLYKNGYCN